MLLLTLFALSGLLITGLYLTETTIIAPLAQFFRPINGDTNGSIDRRAWNLLLLGSDNDQKFVFPDLLTQVMMVIHVNPLTNSVTMVSIPRDSWVSVPGEGMHKIDQAFLLGASAHHNFDDGVRLARATIEQDYGVSIDRYAWVGLDGFSNVINTLGGVDIDVTHPLVDDNYPDDTGQGAKTANPYAVKRLYLAPGAQHLSGDQALEYVRSRHADLVGDIGRTQRQQEVLQALKKKLDIATIFNHLSELFHDLTGKVYSDLSQSELLSVATFARDLPSSSMQRITLGPGAGDQNYGTLTQASDPSQDESQDIVRPNCATIQPVINRVFDLGDTQSCQVNGGG
jgi:LCP family protein required for cell wall assembly